MFIGSLVLFLAGIVIIAKTSTPVFNKVFGSNIAPPEDPEFAHNQIQVFVAIVLGLLTAVTQFLKYKDTPKKQFGKQILLPTIISVLISLCISLFGAVQFDKKALYSYLLFILPFLLPSIRSLEMQLISGLC